MLEIQHLYKSFGRFQAVEDLQLNIDKGCCFGFVGPNGAGKTTTMKMVAGLLVPDQGEIYVDQVNIQKSPELLKMKIGYMPDFFGVYDNLKVLEYMEFYASMYGMAGEEVKKTCLTLIDLVNLSEKENMYVDSLSRGMKQRLCMARCLVHNPPFLILDEPASGLDPRARFDMKTIIKRLTSMGKTIMISSHILPELTQMCDRIGIMEHGKLILDGNVQELLNKAQQTLDIHIIALGDQEKVVEILKCNKNVKQFSMRENEYIVNFNGDDKMQAQLLSSLTEQGILVNQFYKEAGDLEMLFMRLTKDNKGDN